MKKLMLLFGLVAWISTTNVSFAAASFDETVVVTCDCDKCKNHKCDDKCKADGCSAAKCTHAKEGAASAEGKTEAKSCCKKGEGTASASGKSCCKKGTAASCNKKKTEGATEEK